MDVPKPWQALRTAPAELDCAVRTGDRGSLTSREPLHESMGGVQGTAQGYAQATRMPGTPWGQFGRLKQGSIVRCEPSGSAVVAANIECGSTSFTSAGGWVSRRLCSRAGALLQVYRRSPGSVRVRIRHAGQCTRPMLDGGSVESFRMPLAEKAHRSCGLGTWDCSRCGVSAGGWCRPCHVPLLPLRTLT